ncbi:MAG: aspartate kinase [Planctomycetota bacterium]|jgi:aspartate kinase
MQVYKFGGASVVDAEGIKNIKNILSNAPKGKKLVVISALGKTTNALEEVLNLYIHKDEKYIQFINEIREYHLMVAEELFGINNKLEFKLFALFDKALSFCSANSSQHYGFIYDQIISIGELASTTIISEYLNQNGIENKWLDARSVLRTDNHYTDAKVDWKKTEKLISQNEIINNNDLIITQGFISATKEQNTTTLGREGSDFSGAIFANTLNAEKLVIWKDVKGVYNTDPNDSKNAIFIKELSFMEATEMTYYGAKVIHPKTIRPLQNKEIILEVRSFKNPNEPGTLIQTSKKNIQYPPIIVKKENQVLLSFSSKDFSFTEAENLRIILKSFDKNRLKINIIQTGAITLSVVVDNKIEKINQIKEELSASFKIKFNTKLSLITIRHYDFYSEDTFLRNKEILLQQRTRETLQVLIKEEK